MKLVKVDIPITQDRTYYIDEYIVTYATSYWGYKKLMLVELVYATY